MGGDIILLGWAYYSRVASPLCFLETRVSTPTPTFRHQTNPRPHPTNLIWSVATKDEDRFCNDIYLIFCWYFCFWRILRYFDRVYTVQKASWPGALSRHSDPPSWALNFHLLGVAGYLNTSQLFVDWAFTCLWTSFKYLHIFKGKWIQPAPLSCSQTRITRIYLFKGVLYSMLGPDLWGLTVAVWNIVERCISAIPISGAIGLIVAESGH